MAIKQGAWAAARAGKRLPGAGMRDGMYEWAGGFGSKGKDKIPGSLDQRVLGRRRVRNTAIGAGGLGMVNRMRSPGSSGRDGLQPHSTGGVNQAYNQEMMY